VREIDTARLIGRRFGGGCQTGRHGNRNDCRNPDAHWCRLSLDVGIAPLLLHYGEDAQEATGKLGLRALFRLPKRNGLQFQAESRILMGTGKTKPPRILFG